MNSKEMNIISRNNLHNDPLMNAAKSALDTGKAHYILIWIPEESENTLKNLLEKVRCERNIRKDAQDNIVNWYFETINRLHSVNYGPHNLNTSTKTQDEKEVVFLVDRACESGNLNEITTVIPDTPAGEIQQHFNDVMKKRDYDVENIAAGRVYVSAFTDFIAFVNNLRSRSL
jgi:hypothetical protein